VLQKIILSCILIFIKNRLILQSCKSLVAIYNFNIGTKIL
jgi:hypothetical protein